ncbi:MAG: hypothetical protein JXN63_02155, partial [Candidatus Delongbacteria bacterium]|nr:hypothetical protein [Candidatus Delongbacteria bacterium]
MKIFIIILLLIVSTGFSKTIYGEYTYTYGDDEALTEAKQKCITMAKRDAVEKFATFLRSETIIRNYITEKDEIVANAEAMMTDTKIIEENIDRTNSTIYYRISAEVDEKKILGAYEEREKMRLEKAEAERKKQELKLAAERKALEDKLEHERELARIASETEKYKMSRELSEKDRRFWRTQKWIGLGAFAGSAALGTYFNSQADSYYDDYENATSTQNALDYYDKANSNKDYRNITFSVSLVPLGYFFYAW